MADTYTVGGLVPLHIAEQGLAYDALLYNPGTTTVFVGEDLTISQDVANKGIPIPPLTYKEWFAGRPLYAMMLASSASGRLQIQRNNGLLTAPIGQQVATLYSLAQGTVQADGVARDSGILDVSRFQAVQITRSELGVAAYLGTGTRSISMTWYADSAGSVPIETEIHIPMLAFGIWKWCGAPRGPYLRIVEGSVSVGQNFQIDQFNVLGFTQPIGREYAFYANGLSGTSGIVNASNYGDAGDFVLNGNIPAGGTVTDYPTTWAGPAVAQLRIASQVPTDAFQVSIGCVATLQAVTSLTPDTAAAAPERDTKVSDFYVPTRALAVVVNNATAAAVGSCLVSIAYARRT